MGGTQSAQQEDKQDAAVEEQQQQQQPEEEEERGEVDDAQTEQIVEAKVSRGKLVMLTVPHLFIGAITIGASCVSLKC